MNKLEFYPESRVGALCATTRECIGPECVKMVDKLPKITKLENDVDVTCKQVIAFISNNPEYEKYVCDQFHAVDCTGDKIIYNDDGSISIGFRDIPANSRMVLVNVDISSLAVKPELVTGVIFVDSNSVGDLLDERIITPQILLNDVLLIVKNNTFGTNAHVHIEGDVDFAKSVIKDKIRALQVCKRISGKGSHIKQGETLSIMENNMIIG